MSPQITCEVQPALLAHYTVAVSEEPEDLPHTLLPLRLAAELIFSKVYEGRVVTSREEALDSIASTIAVLVPIYEYSADSQQPARRLSRVELEGGMFKGGARELRFIDGREPRLSLAVAANDVTHTIDTLKSASD
jgi:hypothetical protein